MLQFIVGFQFRILTVFRRDILFKVFYSKPFTVPVKVVLVLRDDIFFPVIILQIMPEVYRPCEEFLRMTRRRWPGTRLSLVTNGLLLLRQTSAFWQTCRETRTMIDMSWYPVMTAATMEEIKAKCREEGVVLRITRIERFLDKFREKGDEDGAAAYRACRRTQYCPYLRDGRLYPCATAYHLADRMTGRRHEEGIDVKTHSAREIMRYLLTPVDACRFCAVRPGEMIWTMIDAGANPCRPRSGIQPATHLDSSSASNA